MGIVKPTNRANPLKPAEKAQPWAVGISPRARQIRLPGMRNTKAGYSTRTKTEPAIPGLEGERRVKNLTSAEWESRRAAEAKAYRQHPERFDRRRDGYSDVIGMNVPLEREHAILLEERARLQAARDKARASGNRGLERELAGRQGIIQRRLERAENYQYSFNNEMKLREELKEAKKSGNPERVKALQNRIRVLNEVHDEELDELEKRHAGERERSTKEREIAASNAQKANKWAKDATAARDTAMREVERLKRELEVKQGWPDEERDHVMNQLKEAERRVEFAESRAKSAEEDRENAQRAGNAAEARLRELEGAGVPPPPPSGGPAPQTRGTPQEGREELRRRMKKLEKRQDKRLKKLGKKLGKRVDRVIEELRSGAITHEQAGEEVGDIIQQGGREEGVTREDLARFQEDILEQVRGVVGESRQPASEAKAGSYVDELKKAGLSARDIERIVKAREGIPTGAAAFAENGRNLGRGLMGIFNPGIFASLLMVVIIVLLIYIVLHLFKFVNF